MAEGLRGLKHLHWVAQNGPLHEMQRAFKDPYYKTAIDYYGKRVIEDAAEYGNFDIVKFMYENGLKYKLQNYCNHLMSKIIEDEQKRMLKYLYINDLPLWNDDYAKLAIKMENGRLLNIGFLWRKSKNVRVFENYSIKHAARNGHSRIFRFMYRKCVNTHVKNNLVIKEAILFCNFKIVKFLRKKGIDTNMCANIIIAFEEIDNDVDFFDLLARHNFEDIRTFQGACVKRTNTHHKLKIFQLLKRKGHITQKKYPRKYIF